MRVRVFLLLLCFYHNSAYQALGKTAPRPFVINPQNIVKDIFKKYKTPEEILWSQYFEIDLQSIRLLHSGLFQEAEWRLAEEGNKIGEEAVHSFLNRIMAEGKVFDLKDLGMGGATRPQAASLSYGVVGVFKEKKSLHPSADYRSEIAAYNFDRLIGFRLVPMTVKRKINKRKGSMQYFVKNSESVVKLKDYRRSKNLNVFDYLISNKDRNEGNLLIANGREIAIDHGLALRGANLLGRYLKLTDRVANTFGIASHPIRQIIIHPSRQIEEYQADESILKGLEFLSLEDLRNSLKKNLDESRINRIFDKKNRLLNKLIAADLYAGHSLL
ncbi:MAG: hypothetical protein AB8G05_03945 [Oligoflexales bacterium]